MAKGCTRVRMIMTLDVDVTAERRHYNTHRPLKGKRLTTFCASLALLPNVFAVHRFARGGRRLAVRTAIVHPIGALPRTPFPASRDFPSRGNEKIGGTGYCVTYDTDSQSRNADFISIARRAIRNPQRRRRCRPLSGSEPQPFYTTRGAAAPLFFNMTVGCHGTFVISSGAACRYRKQMENALMIL